LFSFSNSAWISSLFISIIFLGVLHNGLFLGLAPIFVEPLQLLIEMLSSVSIWGNTIMKYHNISNNTNYHNWGVPIIVIVSHVCLVESYNSADKMWRLIFNIIMVVSPLGVKGGRTTLATQSLSNKCMTEMWYK